LTLQLSAGLLPQYNLQAYNSNMVLVPHSNGWTPPGAATSHLALLQSLKYHPCTLFALV
jgi:hypothetical protein